MENTIRESISETLDVLKHLPDSIISKIPDKFLNYLKENSDKEYKTNINYSNENWIDTLSEDTIQMLSIIYRDYIVDSETREKLIEEENAIIEKEKEKYNIDKIFKKKEKVDNQVNSKNEGNQSLVIYEELPWYKKFFEKIIILKKKKKIKIII